MSVTAITNEAVPRRLRVGAILLFLWGVMHVIAGAMNAIELWRDPARFFAGLGASTTELTSAPGFLRLTIGISAIWAAALIGLGACAIALARGPFRSGARWAWWTALVGFGVPDAGAAIFWMVARPPMPLPLMLAIGIGLFLSALLVTAPPA